MKELRRQVRKAKKEGRYKYIASNLNLNETEQQAKARMNASSPKGSSSNPGSGLGLSADQTEIDQRLGTVAEGQIG